MNKRTKAVIAGILSLGILYVVLVGNVADLLLTTHAVLQSPPSSRCYISVLTANTATSSTIARSLQSGKTKRRALEIRPRTDPSRET